MFNALARIAGITVLGGAAVFAGYSLTRGEDPDAAMAEKSDAAVLTEATDTTPATAPDGTIAGAPTLTDELDDLLSTDEIASSTDEADLPTDPYDEDRLAALGEGGVLGNAPDADELPEALSEVIDNAEDKLAESTLGAETASTDLPAETKAILDDLSTMAETNPMDEVQDAMVMADAGDMASSAVKDQPGLRGLPSAPPSTDEEAEKAADEGSSPRTATATSAGEPAETDLASDDGREQAPVASEPRQAETSATDETGNVTDTALATVSQTADQITSPVAAATAPSTGGPAAPTRVANRIAKDKPDDGRFFVANNARIDKPDDGAYFTAQDSGSSFAPCVKADGTPYIGPGTALNPFADESPCLPQATAQSFDVAENLLVATDSDGMAEPPQWPTTPDPRITIPPLGPNFTSDYSTL